MVPIIIIHNNRSVVFATQMAAYDCIAKAAMPVERLPPGTVANSDKVNRFTSLKMKVGPLTQFLSFGRASFAHAIDNFGGAGPDGSLSMLLYSCQMHIKSTCLGQQGSSP